MGNDPWSNYLKTGDPWSNFEFSSAWWDKKKRKWLKEKWKNVTLGWKPKRAVWSENEKIPKTHGGANKKMKG